MQVFDSSRVSLDMEPNNEIEIGDHWQMSIDLPDIAPSDPITIICTRCKMSLHGQDEFLAIDATIEMLPEAVNRFFSEIFPSQNFEVTIYKK